MRNHILGKFSAAACALAALGVLPAHAGQNAYDPNGGASQLGPGATFTTPYPAGDANLNVPSPYSQIVGGETITFTATGEPVDGNFESFRNQVPPGSTTPALDFVPDTQLLDTFDPRPGADHPSGPLQITFSQGVTSFGLSVQSGGGGVPDFEQFQLVTNLGTFPLTQVYDNTTGSGRSVFLGAQATNGDVFTSVTISSLSTSDGTTPMPSGNNDIYFGPLGFQGPRAAPVPEASSALGLGLSLAMFGGLAVAARRKRAARAA